MCVWWKVDHVYSGVCVWDCWRAGAALKISCLQLLLRLSRALFFLFFFSYRRSRSSSRRCSLFSPPMNNPFTPGGRWNNEKLWSALPIALRLHRSPLQSHVSVWRSASLTRCVSEREHNLVIVGVTINISAQWGHNCQKLHPVSFCLLPKLPAKPAANDYSV